jgi:hypothetical protein
MLNGSLRDEFMKESNSPHICMKTRRVPFNARSYKNARMKALELAS